MNESLSLTAQIAILTLQLGVILFAARFFGDLAKKLKVPSVLGELVAGIVIGPYLLGGIGFDMHGFHNGLFPLLEGASVPVSTPLYAIATLGSIVLLFMSGLETDLRMFFKYSVVGSVVGLGGVIFSFVFGDVIGMVALKASFMDPRCLFLGILCTATSVGITARILSEKKSIDSPEGVTILAAAVIDDVLGIICLAIVMGIVTVSASAGGHVDWAGIGWIAFKSFGIWLGVTLLGLVLAHKIAAFLKWFKSAATFSILALGLALLLAGLFEQAGLAMIIGAYIMGLSLSKTDISFSIQSNLHPVYNFLVPVFFVVMGMLVDVRVMADTEVLTLGLIYSAVAVLAKILGCALPAYFMNFNMLGALRIGTGMIPRGEVALIIGGIGVTTMMTLNGQKVPILDSRLFGVGIIMTLITTLVAPPLLNIMLSRKGKGVKQEVKDTSTVHTAFSFPSEVVADFVLQGVMENFRREGFRHSALDKEAGIIHLRRNDMVFAMTVHDCQIVFDSNPDEVFLIKAVMYETFVELHQCLNKLKELSRPEEIRKQLFDGKRLDENDIGKYVIPIERIILSDCIVTELTATTKEGVIEELIDVLDRNKRLADRAKCLSAVLERENTVSTCLPGGLALPHGRTDGVYDLACAIGIKKEGYAFDAPDKEVTKIIILSLCPKDSNEPFLQFMSQVAAVLNSKENIADILKASSAGEIRKIMIARK